MDGIVTIQRRKIQKFGLERFFPLVLIAGELGTSKPDPYAFHVARGRLGLAADRCLVVGDSVEREVKGARAAGLRVALVHRSAEALDASEPAPDFMFPDLRPLAEGNPA